MPIQARRHVRRMRGGAQAHLLEAEDGRFFVVKFQTNPQHRRVLVNELVASVFLNYLQIAAPAPALIEVTPGFLRDNPQVSAELGGAARAYSPGVHFGSQFPGDPDRLVVYDFLPDPLLARVTNFPDFRGALVLDKWVANADARQAVFFRARLKQNNPGPQPAGANPVFVAWMIDNGFIFNGPHWDFPDSPVQGLYFRKTVYLDVRSISDFQPWLDLVVHFPEEVVDKAYRQVPPDWIEGEEDHFEKLLERLLRRRKRVPDLLSDCRAAKVNPFPNWT